VTNYPPLLELRAAIVLAGYRFDRFADKVGLSPTFFNHQLAGRKKPHPELFRRAALILRCDERDIRPREAELVA
jgi:hypothetical protein